MNLREHADYQKFDFNDSGQLINVGLRMEQKLAAIRDIIPDLYDAEVLDIGCDFGFWSFMSSNLGAKRVVGLDRNRNVKNVGFVDLIALNNEIPKIYETHKGCEFHEIHIGEQWKTYGKFDVIYLMSLYHHIFQSCKDHRPIWFWLRQQIKDNGVVIWENPTDVRDPVSYNHVDKSLHTRYTRQDIFDAASLYFHHEYIGPALHEDTRQVYKLYPKPQETLDFQGIPHGGAGGASKAFTFCDHRRQKEIEKITGVYPIPGSLNLFIDSAFPWDRHYYRSQVLDVKDRSQGLESEWIPRWARFYPVLTNDFPSFVFRFENERYPSNFVEIISATKLRDHIGKIVHVHC